MGLADGAFKNATQVPFSTKSQQAISLIADIMPDVYPLQPSSQGICLISLISDMPIDNLNKVGVLG